MLRLICACFVLFTYSSNLKGQTPAQPATETNHSQEAVVFEQIKTKIAFENDGTGSRETTVRVRIQSEAGVQRLGVLTVSYQSLVEGIDIPYVRVRKPDGTIVTTPPENIQDMASEITRQAPFYSDLREKHIAVKGLSPGDVLEYQFRSQLQKPLAPGQFWTDFNFVHEGIALDEKFEVSVPQVRNISIRASTFNRRFPMRALAAFIRGLTPISKINLRRTRSWKSCRSEYGGGFLHLTFSSAASVPGKKWVDGMTACKKIGSNQRRKSEPRLPSSRNPPLTMKPKFTLFTIT
jgi:Domain of Unknown Function with PDB structure (DUF3857)